MLLRRLVSRLGVILLTFLWASPPAAAKPPLEAFGDAPTYRLAELSPSGKEIAFIRNTPAGDVLMLFDIQTSSTTALANLKEFKPVGLSFPNGNFLLLRVSTTERAFVIGDKYERDAAFAFDIRTRSFVQLLSKVTRIHEAQSGMGRVLAVDPDGEHVYMPAFTGETFNRGSKEPSLDLLKINLKTGGELKGGARSGKTGTVDWFLDDKGGVVAREDFFQKTNIYEVYAYDGSSTRSVFSDKPDFYSRNILALMPGRTSLLVGDVRQSEQGSLFEMSLQTGELTRSGFDTGDSDVERVIVDRNRTVLGVEYAGAYPTYRMSDEALNRDITGVQEKLAGMSVSLDSWSDDLSLLLLHVSGGYVSERYVLFNRATGELKPILTTRPDIKPEHVGEVVTMRYEARDGLSIPGLITWPTGVAEADRKKLPMIVMPHGGPSSYDAVGFDWLAQFFANEGFVVLQPNFRGSSGFGLKFLEAGYGEWGRKMQDDVTDGAKALIDAGWADPDRVCIVGWSYGGYSALAGVALTPDLYQCVVSIAGVTDLIEMLNEERRTEGERSAAFRYWSRVIGDPDRDRAAIEAVSPVVLADRFTAPVLLIHGDNDTVVPVRQSDRMEKALRDAGKPVEYMRLKGDDHGLAESGARSEALRRIAEFVAAHTRAD